MSPRSTKIPPPPRNHWPAGWLLLFALVLLAVVALRFLAGCAELLPALAAAGPIAASGLDAYSKALEAARANGATPDQLAQILAGITEILRLEREHAAKCEVEKRLPEDPAALARAMQDKAVLGEQLALERAKVATLLEAVARQRTVTDGGVP